MKKVFHVAFNHPYIEHVSKAIDVANAIDASTRHFLIMQSMPTVATHQWQRDMAGITVIPHETATEHVAALIDLHKPDLVILHGMFMMFQAATAIRYGATVPTVWIVWGGDFYSNLNSEDGRNTLAMVAQSLTAIGMPDCEYQLFARFVTRRPPARVDFYYPIPSVGVAPFHGAPRFDGKYVVVGNSGDPGNNHEEIFQAIARKEDAAEYQIVVPFGYNGDQEYLGRLQSAAAGLKLRTAFLTSFVDPPEYADIIGRSAGFITAHHRQQAVGNLVTAVVKGVPAVMRRSILVNGEAVANPGWAIMEDSGVRPVDWNEFDAAPTVASAFTRMRVAPSANELLGFRCSIGGGAETLIRLARQYCR